MVNMGDDGASYSTLEEAVQAAVGADLARTDALVGVFCIDTDAHAVHCIYTGAQIEAMREDVPDEDSYIDWNYETSGKPQRSDWEEYNTQGLM